MQFDVLVIGAGPAGSAAARTAAAQGLTVALVDREDFPRDKVCGDGLVPDAIDALRELGLAAAVLPKARRSTTLRAVAPNGRSVRFATESCCIPRLELDDALRIGAVEAGATFRPRHRLKEPLLDRGRIAGARFTDALTGSTVDVRAGTTILATGAAAGPLESFGVCRRASPSATAARFYVEVEPGAAGAFGDLLISYEAATCPGYGWIFPGPGHVFNVGVGYFYDARRRFTRVNLRTLLDRFLTTFPPAVGLMRAARWVTPLRGAPLRTAMAGADLSRPGLLVAGEAAGLTYSLTGEGIGKSLQSGMLAGDIVAAHRNSPGADRRIAEVYAATLTDRFGSRFRAYRTAQQWVSVPALGNFLAARADRDGFVCRQIEALLSDQGDPRDLFSLRGMLRAVWS